MTNYSCEKESYQITENILVKKGNVIQNMNKIKSAKFGPKTKTH